MLSPLQFPGAPEFLVILFVLVFNLLIVAAVIAGVVCLLRRLGDGDGGESERIEELESAIRAEE